MRSTLRRLVHDLARLLSRRRVARDRRELDDELRSYEQTAIDDRIGQGVSPEDARRQARAAIGSPAAVREHVRDVGWTSLVEDLWRDARHALRVLRRSPGFTTVTVLTLAVGIGANTTIFSAASGLFLRPVPVRDPDGLVRLRHAGPNDMAVRSMNFGYARPEIEGERIRATFSYPMYRTLLEANRTLTDLVAEAPLIFRLNVGIDGVVDAARGTVVSGNYFEMLGVSARLGRTLLPDDDRPEAPAAAVISHRYWRSRFAGRTEVVGQTVTVNEVPLTVVGVLPPDFSGVQSPVALAEPADVLLPLALHPRLYGQSQLQDATFWWLHLVGRLRPGASASQVQDHLQGVFQRTARAGLEAQLAGLSEEERNTSRNRSRTEVPRLLVDSARHGIYDPDPDVTRMVSRLGFVVGLVLLIACANVASLLLSRGVARQQELSVRGSLGATRGRLVRQLLVESLMLALLGGAIGLALGWGGRLLLPEDVRVTTLDWRVAGFALLATVTAGLLFGTAPALRATASTLTGGRGQRGSGGPARPAARTGRLLVVVQVAVSLVLLGGAGLLVQTVRNLRQVDVGFDTARLLLFRVEMSNYDAARTRQALDELTRQIATLPGVQSVSRTQLPLVTGVGQTVGMHPQGRTPEPDQDDEIRLLTVSAGFLDSMGIPVVRGRGFTEQDREGTPRVALITETAARTFFPDENPLGRRFGLSPETSGEIEIVGVVRDIKYERVRETIQPVLFLHDTQYGFPFQGSQFVVRTAGPPMGLAATIQEAVRRVVPGFPVLDLATQTDLIDRTLVEERTLAAAYSSFGLVAVGLASVGLFGLLSYSVSRRTGEIGIRMALGAQPRDVLGQVMRDALGLTGLGLVLGLVGTAAANRAVASQLFGLAATDVPTLAAVALVVTAVGALAAYLPARRAARVDPVTALNAE